jgi:hypothetical protein
MTRHIRSTVNKLRATIALDDKNLTLTVFGDTLQHLLQQLPSDLLEDEWSLDITKFTSEQLELMLLTCPPLTIKYKLPSNTVVDITIQDI